MKLTMKNINISYRKVKSIKRQIKKILKEEFNQHNPKIKIYVSMYTVLITGIKGNINEIENKLLEGIIWK